MPSRAQIPVGAESLSGGRTAFEAVVVGVSSGGIEALKIILSALPSEFACAVVIVQHRDDLSDGYLTEYLDSVSPLRVKEAEDREILRPGRAYIAPAGYHLLIEPDLSFGLSVDDRVNYARPSIDVLFESAAEAYGGRLIGVVLTGANADGALGLRAVRARGGLAIVQDPQSAEAKAMPNAALAVTDVDYVADLSGIAALLVQLCSKEDVYGTGR